MRGCSASARWPPGITTPPRTRPALRRSPRSPAARSWWWVSCIRWRPAADVKTFCLLRSTQTCCYGPRPQYNQYLLVEMREPVRFERLAPVIVEGKFLAEAHPEDGYIYHLDGTSVRAADGEAAEIDAAQAARAAGLKLLDFAWLETLRPAADGSRAAALAGTGGAGRPAGRHRGVLRRPDQGRSAGRHPRQGMVGRRGQGNAARPLQRRQSLPGRRERIPLAVAGPGGVHRHAARDGRSEGLARPGRRQPRGRRRRACPARARSPRARPGHTCRCRSRSSCWQAASPSWPSACFHAPNPAQAAPLKTKGGLTDEFRPKASPRRSALARSAAWPPWWRRDCGRGARVPTPAPRPRRRASLRPKRRRPRPHRRRRTASTRWPSSSTANRYTRTT